MDHNPALIAQLDFRPVPADKRESPGRVKSIPARLYIDKYIEHREAFEFLQDQQDLHGEGSKTLVRALLYYQNTVIDPLLNAQRAGRRAAPLTSEQLIAQLAFRPVPPEQRHSPGRVKHVSARLYIDKYIEHREAFDFIQSQQELFGEGLKTLVRALLHYRDGVIATEQTEAPGRAQLSLDVSGAGE